jgi:hypothetical protein
MAQKFNRRRYGSAWGPVILPVFKTGGRQVSCRRCVRLAHASANLTYLGLRYISYPFLTNRATFPHPGTISNLETGYRSPPETPGQTVLSRVIPPAGRRYFAATRLDAARL